MQKNALAIDFSLLDQEGNERTLSALLLNGPVVLFFYPAAMSPGCTKESCHFRDLHAEFAKLGAQLVGISLDSPERQAQFARKHGLDYPLLARRRRRGPTLRGQTITKFLEGQARHLRDRSQSSNTRGHHERSRDERARGPSFNSPARATRLARDERRGGIFQVASDVAEYS